MTANRVAVEKYRISLDKNFYEQILIWIQRYQLRNENEKHNATAESWEKICNRWASVCSRPELDLNILSTKFRLHGRSMIYDIFRSAFMPLISVFSERLKYFPTSWVCSNRCYFPQKVSALTLGHSELECTLVPFNYLSFRCLTLTSASNRIHGFSEKRERGFLVLV